MKLSRYEQEVVINFNADEDTATLYTADPVWQRKMDKLAEQNPIDFQCIRSDEVSKTYSFPKRLLCVRSRVKTMTLTEEQKVKARERLQERK